MRGASPQRVLRFDAFTLDLSRYVLLRGADQMPLRRQAFDMLRYLAEHSGTLVTKEELVTAVWRKVAVSDDSLTRCVGDIRDALGDRDQRIIKTVRGRGYLFAVDVVATSGSATPSPTTTVLRAQPWLRVPSILNTARRYVRSAGWRGAAVLAAALMVVAVTVWNLRAPSASAAQYTMLANSITDKERGPKARREALALYDKALALDPDFVPALLGSAHAIIVDTIEHSMPAAERAVRLAQAELAILRAIKLEPSSGSAHRWHGILLRARGEPEQAVPALEQAVALTPNAAWVHADLGRAKIEAGRADEAIRHFETALRLSPADPLAFIWCFQAGMAAVHLGQSETALQWFVKSEQANPAYLRHIMPWRAVAHAELGREDEARALMAQHVANSPGLTLARWNEYFPRRNAIVAAQRERIAAILLRLGLPERGT
jgi:DNA-binding winged helix-turn-helix (wHTH) protein/tetratricopeptide (TPR) repeat protein